MPPSAATPPDWFTRRPPLVQALIVSVLTTLVNQLAPWLLTDLRPPATEMVPAQQQKIDSGAKAAEFVAEVFGE